MQQAPLDPLGHKDFQDPPEPPDLMGRMGLTEALGKEDLLDKLENLDPRVPLGFRELTELLDQFQISQMEGSSTPDGGRTLAH